MDFVGVKSHMGGSGSDPLGWGQRPSPHPFRVPAGLTGVPSSSPSRRWKERDLRMFSAQTWSHPDLCGLHPVGQNLLEGVWACAAVSPKEARLGEQCPGFAVVMCDISSLANVSHSPLPPPLFLVEKPGQIYGRKG